MCYERRRAEGVCVFIIAALSIKLCAGGGGGTVKSMCYEEQRAEACVDHCASLPITH